MDLLTTVGIAAAVSSGVIATLAILRRPPAPPREDESPFAVSTEGEKRCPACGMGNLWTQRTCISCGRRLAG